MNPVHGEDLAAVCDDAIVKNDHEIKAGGSEELIQNQIMEIAFKAYDKKIKIKHIPDFVRIIVLKTLKIFTISRFYGPIEFFLTAETMDFLLPNTVFMD